MKYDYDIVVVGGGPSGMMAAGRAGQLGCRVLLIEKNKEMGIKLLMTGKERCNVTHYSENPNDLIEFYGKNGRFLYSGFANFSNLDVIDFFEKRGVKMKIERGARVFPASDKSMDIRKVLLDFLEEGNVKILKGKTVKDVIKNSQKEFIESIILLTGEKINAKRYIIATGGLSYPATGATGDGYRWAKKLGHNIVSPYPALSPIRLKDKFVSNLEGLTIKNVRIDVFKNEGKSCEKKVISRFGEAVFTKQGISGPIILDMSKKIGELLRKNGKGATLRLRIDFKPAMSFEKLDKRIQRDFQKGNNKQFKNILNKLLPKKIIPVLIKLSEINPDKRVNLITKEERKKLTRLLKEFPLTIKEVVGFGKAIITTGGIDVTEVNSKTMQSRLVDNLFFTGEVLDLDGPTGGYNLQVCWSTGWTAGSSSAYF